MAWLVAGRSGELLRVVREEIDQGSPRATAIVGAAFVEDHLQRLIQSRLVDDKSVIEQLFGPSSALGSFSAKINVGYLMGLYSKAARRELDCIRTIRNDFAHELHINSFDMDTIRDRCANLRFWERARVSIAEDEGDNIKVKDNPKAMILDFTDGRDRTIPRVRYEAASRFFIALFSLLLTPGRQPEEPEI